MATRKPPQAKEATAPQGAAAEAAPVTAAAKAKPAPPAAPLEPAADPAPAPAAAKTGKPKLVRDSFTIPKDEYLVLQALKQRALGLSQSVKKGELLRAGIRALEKMSDRAFLKAIDGVPSLKTGRPKQAKATSTP